VREVHLPRSLEELWPLLDRRPRAALYAGGTDLLVRMGRGMENPVAFVCLERIEELKGVSEHGDHVHIGPCTTHSRLLAHPLVQRHLPVLARAVKTLGSPLIRNMGTIGGNLCTASPAGDTLPPLYVLEAEVELRTGSRVRRMPVGEFIRGPGITCIEEGEILAGIRVKKPAQDLLHHFEKVGRRNALACAVVSLAALIGFSPDGVVRRAALAWGSVGPTVVRCPEAEAALLGQRLSADTLQQAAALVREAVSPISDLRADEHYRRRVSGNLLLRLGCLPGSGTSGNPPGCCSSQ